MLNKPRKEKIFKMFDKGEHDCYKIARSFKYDIKASLVLIYLSEWLVEHSRKQKIIDLKRLKQASRRFLLHKNSKQYSKMSYKDLIIKDSNMESVKSVLESKGKS